MKKFIELSILLLLTSSFSLCAAEVALNTNNVIPINHKQHTGYKAKQHAKTTVKQFMTQKNNMWVTMQGNIIKKSGKNSYFFRDATGSTTLIIPKTVSHGKKYNAKDLLCVRGQVKIWGNKRVLYVKYVTTP
ncbi:YgiW/YdeI family stress tolerance OB fold protein [Candidatus Pantoea carbekii]|uniref:YgiW/YdeI family stress tolerance OB fold protein n=1 Tax=Candidatus Pantoea carbekii TaxID=1235990 RepID=UPI0006187A1F|nr:NirD/YgiW/YdeI family stress tolerance protein [Candidatus Pantoea carbekii]AKC32627.1 putative bacterial OB fold (BOF) periplasmic protein [Candidatus Pantoea carbekii]